MRTVTSVPKDLALKVGPSVKTLDTGPVYRSLQIAWALSVSEQTVSAWARQGRIPPGTLVMGVRWWSIEELERLASTGVKPVGTYSPIEPGEAKRLADAQAGKKSRRGVSKKGGAR